MPEIENVGFVKIKSGDDVSHLLWKIDDYIFRPQNKHVLWFSPVFKFLSRSWRLVLQPRSPSYYVSLHLKRITPGIPVPCLTYSAGIRNSDGTIHLYTEPKTTSADEFGEVYLIYCKTFLNEIKVIAPKGHVTFFMTICLENNRAEPQTLSDNGEKDRCKLADEKEKNEVLKYNCDDTNDSDDDDDDKNSNQDDIDVLCQNISDLFMNQKNCDVIIKVGEHEFKAHKCILAARSPVFAPMFEYDMVENKSGIVNIEDCDPDAFRDFLYYLYTAKLDGMSMEKVILLYPVAHKYRGKELTKKCLNFMLDNLSVDTFCDVLDLALKYNETALIKSAGNFFTENAEDILVTPKWRLFFEKNLTVVNELYIQHTKRLKQHLGSGECKSE